jgi:hypothetical protein
MNTKREVYKILKRLLNNDHYLEEFLDGDIREEMLTAFCAHELVWIAENDRVLLTTIGEQTLFNFSLAVEPNKKSSKL